MNNFESLHPRQPNGKFAAKLGPACSGMSLSQPRDVIDLIEDEAYEIGASMIEVKNIDGVVSAHAEIVDPDKFEQWSAHRGLSSLDPDERITAWVTNNSDTAILDDLGELYIPVPEMCPVPAVINDVPVKVFAQRYTDGSLAVMARVAQDDPDNDSYRGEVYDDISVNTDYMCEDNQFFVRSDSSSAQALIEQGVIRRVDDREYPLNMARVQLFELAPAN